MSILYWEQYIQRYLRNVIPQKVISVDPPSGSSSGYYSGTRTGGGTGDNGGGGNSGFRLGGHEEEEEEEEEDWETEEDIYDQVAEEQDTSIQSGAAQLGS